MVDMYRTLDSIPVLAKAGGILVMTDEIRGTEAEKNPESLNIRVFPVLTEASDCMRMTTKPVLTKMVPVYLRKWIIRKRIRQCLPFIPHREKQS